MEKEIDEVSFEEGYRMGKRVQAQIDKDKIENLALKIQLASEK